VVFPVDSTVVSLGFVDVTCSLAVVLVWASYNQHNKQEICILIKKQGELKQTYHGNNGQAEDENKN
jgi:hypothetical protein